MAKPTSPRWSNAAAGSLSSRVIRPGIRPASWLASIGICAACLPLRRSITFDRGTEFAAFATLRNRLGITSYFCLPSAPWQKGGVENCNGRIRRFLPSDTDIALLSDKEIQAVADRLNTTPRKCLGYRTPHEVLGEQITLLKAG